MACRRLAALLALLLVSLPLARGGARAAEPMPEEARPSALLRLGAEHGLLTVPPDRAPDPAPDLPPGGRWPVAILLPDSDGSERRGTLYGERLLQNGIALLEPLPDEAAEGMAADRLAASLAAIAADPRLDGRRIAVLGLGAGARQALLGLAARPAPVALALLYPGCDAALAELARGLAGLRVLLLHGDADPANDAAACAALAAAFPASARPRHRLLPGTGYGWDALGLAPPGAAVLLPDPAGQARRLRAWPDPDATLIAADQLLGFLLAAFGR
ncbi:hypothetical protein DOO78_16470 [Roseicella frigidaeris]|uniref:Dienelactone hydrolase domain-containing protein n=2 Tax=Roseicella frigidaeris TaxID=2230885 RepID=A0A327M3K3_9PROT|nr:hypothetical protein DOO78_16470 [Roseicella frigidaeris]